MTAFRDLKRIIRERQLKTDESYTSARAHVLHERAELLGEAPENFPTAEPERVEAVVLKVNRQSARVAILGETGQLTFRSGGVWRVVPGHRVTLAIDRRWTWKGDAYASGQAENPRVAVDELGRRPRPVPQARSVCAAVAPAHRPVTTGFSNGSDCVGAIPRCGCRGQSHLRSGGPRQNGRYRGGQRTVNGDVGP